MNIYVLDNKLNTIAIFDVYASLIWTNRYYKVGDFELHIPLTDDVKNCIKQDYFIYRECDFHDGIINSPKVIEHIELIDNENENSLLVSGRDVTSLFDRRIIYPTEILKGNVEECVLEVINHHALLPDNDKRKMDIFDVVKSQTLEYDIDKQVTGDDLLKFIESVCADFKIGFRTDFDIAHKKFIFRLYEGDDKTQGISKVVINRPNESMLNFNYVNDKVHYKNMAIVAGAGEGDSRKVIKINDELCGIERRELYVDARDIIDKNDSGEAIPEDDYTAQLNQRGSEKLTENKVDITNACEVDPDAIIFKYNRDYYLGDKVICEGYTEFEERIVETIESSTVLGDKTELTFEEVEDNG